MSKQQRQTLEPHVLVLDTQQSYKRLEEDALIRSVREACRYFAVHHLPYRLSPVILGVPGLLLHLFLLVAVHNFERARWMYALWVVCRVLHFCLDAMDGTLARRNGTQSTARHFWDHWVDVVNSAMAVLIIARLGPQHGVLLLPYVLLTAIGQLFFYLGLCRYFATGIMREPYGNHLWNYVFCLFLGLSVCFHDVAVLETPGFQLTYSLLSLLAFGLGVWSLLRDFVLMYRSPLSSLRFYARILTAPALILGLYVAWLQHWSDVFSARALVAIAMSSLAVSVHARQLVNKPPLWLTAESALFLLVIPLSLLPSSLQPALHHGLLLVMVGAMLLGLYRYLREMISRYPAIGFPLLWLPSTHRPVPHPHVSNKLAA
ncbi:CDP-alcohol phosphatidyltransferase family protein [Archangium lipolyticum]|uniref:CDP-alcohol phosphatidyltransferase family protein n=1 Tax=Archangium lipolyticum TaxID=2970465 RepID=UPI00214A77B6|nr:CDP-alcohol phosphatidyltransferase family protein [Archangium lipolyticum]